MRPSHLACFALLLAPLLALAAPQPPAEKPPGIAPPTTQDQADKRMAFMKSALSHFAVQVGDRKQASKAADPCLRWTDPVTGASEGVLAVYAHDGGRPDAIAQFFFNFQKRWIVEFTVIPGADVTVLRSGRELWKPTEFVCKFADLPGAPTPADRPALRLP